MKFRNEYWFLSNMYPTKIEIEGLTFDCAEAAFQSFKTLDMDERKQFEGIDGFTAKKLGRRIKLRKDWNNNRLEIMKRVVKAKFQQHPYLKEKLLALNEYIVEDNTWNDKFWGRCNGKGENNLGKILMEVRQELKYPPRKNKN